MLVEMAIADSYGAGFEFAPRKFVRQRNDLSGYVSYRPGREGRYTDDTQMSIALAEILVAEEEFDNELVADWFLACYKRDPRPGYARGFRGFLESVSSGQEFLDKISPASSRSGAAMRACPLGVLPTTDDVKDWAVKQSKLTHDTPTGARSASAAALMAHYFIYDVGKKKDLGRWLEGHVSGKWTIPHKGKVSMHGCQVVRAAVTAVVQCDSMSDILRRCVGFTGDVDTVAAIALASAAASWEVAQDLPAQLLSDLEDGPYGRTFLEDLDDHLMRLT